MRGVVVFAWVLQCAYLALVAACAVAGWTEGLPWLAVALFAVFLLDLVRLVRRGPGR